MYASSWLAKAIVDRRAGDMFREWREWMNVDADGITKIERVEADLGLKQKYKEAMVNARRSGVCYVYFDNGEKPDQPINLKSARPIRFAHVILRSEVMDGDIDDDPMSENYGNPAWYSMAGSSSSSLVRIHPSRMVRFVGNRKAQSSSWCAEYESVLVPCLDAIKSHDMVALNIADMTSEAKLDIISVKGLMDALGDPVQEAAIIAKFALMSQMKNARSVNVLDAETEEWQQKTMSFATLPDILKGTQIEVAGAAAIPRALLFGVTEGGMGSTGNLELSSYYDGVNADQENIVRPATHILDRLVVKTALGTDNQDVHYKWSSLWQESDEVRTQNGVRIADKWVKLAGADIFPAEMLAEVVANDLTEAGVGANIEVALADWIALNGDDLPDDDDGAMIEQTNEADE